MDSKRINIHDCFGQRIAEMEASGQFSTSWNYRRTLASFQRYREEKPLLVDRLTAEEIARYNRFLREKGLLRNTISFYNRILRAVFNHAVAQGYARQSHPFRDVYTGVDVTRKRALPADKVRQIALLELTDSELVLARDLFLFSFQARGMSFVDMAFLTRENLRAGNIRYVRHKTRQMLDVRIEPWMRCILERYRPKCYGPYLLPVLSTLDPQEAFAQYRRALCRHNRRLRTIGALVGLDYPLSTYAARHSWATVARDSLIPLSVISSAMGHSSEKTTKIYLASLDNSLIDRANRQVWHKVAGSQKK